MVCPCNDSTVVRSCPPYANADDVNELLASICPDCSATVVGGTLPANFCAEFGGAIDECCEYLTVFEGNNIWFSNDCTTWRRVSVSAWSVGDIKIRTATLDDTNLWLRLDGRTIGNAVSGGTARANADMEALFTHLWTNFSNTELVIQTSAGVPTVRGVSAAVDFAAPNNFRMPIPDARGTVISMMDDPTGADAAGVVTDASADTLGGSMGAETHQLIEAEMPSHTHTANRWYPSDGSTVSGVALGKNSTTRTPYQSVSVTGSDTAHNNIQPTLFFNYFIFTGN